MARIETKTTSPALVAAACGSGPGDAAPAVTHLHPAVAASSTTARPRWSAGGHDLVEIWGGHVRHARVVVPVADVGLAPLIVALHGVGGNGQGDDPRAGTGDAITLRLVSLRQAAEADDVAIRILDVEVLRAPRRVRQRLERPPDCA